jgi:hypothetical protein
VLVRDPAALTGLVAAVRTHATAASPFIMLEQSIDGAPYQIVAHALFASGPPHALLGFMAFTVTSGGCRRNISIRSWNRSRRSAAAGAASR